MDARRAALTYLALVGATLALGLLSIVPPRIPLLDLPFGLLVSGAGPLLLLAPQAARDGRPWLAATAGALAGAAAAGGVGALLRTLALVGDPAYSQPTPLQLARVALYALVATGSAAWFVWAHGRASGVVLLAAWAAAVVVGALPLAWGWVLLAAHVALVAAFLPVRRDALECARAAGLGLALSVAFFVALLAIDGEARGRGIITSDEGFFALMIGVSFALLAALVALLFWRADGWRVRGALAE